MKKKLLTMAIPAGLIIEAIYLVGNRFFVHFPDWAAYPMMIVSIGLILTGLAYRGYSMGKRRRGDKNR